MECPTCQTNNPDDSRYCKACATPLPYVEKIDLTKTLKTPSRKSLVGTMIAGKYKIVAELGKGGMGIVYKAEDIRLRRTAALKFLPPELTRDEEARERFIQEARAASALDHNNICTIYEIADSEDEHFFIAMAFYDGQSLRQKIDRGPIDEKETAEIAVQLAQGLAKAHGQGIVHRDIKPANIIITRDGVAKILDFGLAKLTGQVRLTRTGTTMGTVAYMSPEQAQGREVDHRTDIWSLGVVLYEMLTGELPFQGEHEQSLMYSILNEVPHPLKIFRPGLPDAFERILATALAKKPEDRYQKADDLLDDLRSVTEGLRPLKAKAKSFQKRILGIRKSLFITGAAALVLLSIVAGVLLLTGRSSAIESIAILPFEGLGLDEELSVANNGITYQIINKLQGIGLRVPGLAAVEPFVGKPLKEVGESLNVSTILSGTFQSSGNKLRVNAQLVKAADGLLLWSDIMEFARAELFALQDAITMKIIDGLKLNLRPEERELVRRVPTKSNKAYELYIKGEIEFQRVGGQNWASAEKYYKWAIEEDPDFASAHAGLARIYLYAGGQDLKPTQEAYRLAKQHARIALDLDDSLPQAHTIMGEILAYMDWKWAEAEKEYNKSISINPKDARVHTAYGSFLSALGRSADAIKECRLAVKLDNTNFYHKLSLAWILLDALRYEECIKTCKEFLGEYPHLPNIYIVLGLAYSGNRMYKEAVDAANKGVDMSSEADRPVWEGYLGHIYGEAGQRKEALKILEKLIKEEAPGGWIITVYIGLSDLDTSFSLLEDAFLERKQWLVTTVGSKYFSRIFQGDPRYHDIRRRMNLAEY